MMQIVEQTHEEKVKMYMKCSKKELIAMLIECNRIISSRPLTFSVSSDAINPIEVHPFEPDINSTAMNCKVCGQSKWYHQAHAWFSKSVH